LADPHVATLMRATGFESFRTRLEIVSQSPSRLLPMGLPRARMKLAQHRKLIRVRGRRDGDCGGVFHLPPRIPIDLFPRHPRMDRHHGHFLRPRIGLEHAQIRDELRRPLGPHPQAGAMVAAFAVAERGDEIEFFHEAAPALRHGDEDFPARYRDFWSAAAARQAHLGAGIGAHHRGVEIGVSVDLGAAQKAHRDAAALEPVAEHFRHRYGGERGVAQFAVADRERQDGRPGGDGAGFVDQRDAGRMGEAGEIAGGRRHADADEADIARFEGARGRDGHHLGRGKAFDLRKALGHAAPVAARPSRRRCSANTSGPRSSTLAFIQARKPSRSREIPSHFL